MYSVHRSMTQNKMPRIGTGIETLESRRLLAGDLLITEFMAKNDGFLEDGDGNAPDWIEIQNTSDSIIDLEGYRLTDDLQNTKRWTFPSRALSPGEFLVVFASGQDSDDYVDADGNLHSNFSLGANGENLALVAPDGNIVSQIGDLQSEYPPQRSNVSYGLAQQEILVDRQSDLSYLIPTDDFAEKVWFEPDFDPVEKGFSTGKAAIGFEGAPDSRLSLANEIVTALPTEPNSIYARIEFNLTDIEHIDGLNLRMKYDDGFIAYLNGKPVAEANAPPVRGWSSMASIRRRDSNAQEFEDYDLAGSISELKEGLNVLAIHGLNHVADLSSFLISPELVAFTNRPDAKVGFMISPTPGAANVAAESVFSNFLDEPTMSVAAGFYDEPFGVTIETTAPDVQIRYTTDGSRPSATTGSVYTGTIQIETTTTLRSAVFLPDHVPSDVVSHSYLFLNDVIRQSNDQPGLPTRWKQASFDFAADYEMDQDIVNNPAYRDEIIDGLKSIRTMSITLDPDNFLSPEGIYIQTSGHGVESERAVSVEIIDSEGESFQVDAGLRNNGNRTRDFDVTLKQSFRLVFSPRHGARKLEYPVFPDSPIEQFDNIILHAGKLLDDPQLVRNSFGRDTNRAMGNVDAHSTYFHLYLNGLYWGVYNAFERVDANFAQEYFGGSSEDYDAILNNTERLDGDTQKYNSTWRQLSNGIETKEAFEEFQRQIDLDSLFDLLLINQYMAHDEHELRAIGKREGDSNFKFFIQDVDEQGMNRVSARTDVAQFLPGNAFSSLRDNPETRLRFADRAHKHLFNDGALTPNSAAERWQSRTDEIFSAAIAETARWGDTHWRGVFPRQAVQRDVEMEEEGAFLSDTYFPQRTEILIDQLRRLRIYPEIDAPTFSRFGGTVPPEFELAMSHPNENGTIVFTLDGTDPRMFGGDVGGNAQLHGGSTVVVSQDMVVKARVLSSDGEWSALTEATFSIRSTDLNEDGLVDAADIDAICADIHTGDHQFDLNGDNEFDYDDVVFFVRTMLQSEIGDSNLDGKFELDDLQIEEYDDGIPGNSTWSEGDWNCDGDFDSKDIVIAFSEGSPILEALNGAKIASNLIGASIDANDDRWLVSANRDREARREL